MKECTATSTYTILDLQDIESFDYQTDTAIDQVKGDKLEVWKEREDGFLFVYCNQLEIGYWVNPKLVEVNI
jgi:hypothetical protein